MTLKMEKELPMPDPFIFRGTHMQVRVSTEAASGAYTLIEMQHPANIGPSLHIHPRGAETFFILEGEYHFTRDEQHITAQVGETVVIPQGIPHRYVSGAKGGRALVICPPDLENYFTTVSKLLQAGPLDIEQEFSIASKYGQDFLDRSSHWNLK